MFRTSREGTSFQSIVSAAKEAELMEREEFGNPKRARISGQFQGASSGGRGSQRVSGFFSSGDLFMHLCRHLRVARHLGVLMAQVRARTVHNSDLQGEEIIVGFQGPHNSSQVRDFVLLVEIPII